MKVECPIYLKDIYIYIYIYIDRNRGRCIFVTPAMVCFGFRGGLERPREANLPCHCLEKVIKSDQLEPVYSPFSEGDLATEDH